MGLTPRPVELKLSRAQAEALADVARVVNAGFPSDDRIAAQNVIDEAIRQYDADARREAELEARFETRMAEQRVKAEAALAKLPKGYKVMQASVGSYERVAAVRSRAEFARLAGFSARDAANHVTETGNGDQMEVAVREIGTMFFRDTRVRDAAWKAAKKS